MPVRKPAPFAWEHDAYKTNYHDCGLTGYTGLDYHTVARLSVMLAARSQIGTRGFYKAGLAELPNGDLIVSPVNMLEPKEKIQGPAAYGYFAESLRVRLHKSKDKGRTWQPIEDHTPLYGKEGAIVCTKKGNLLLMTESMNGIAWSADQGKTWEVTHFDIERDAPYQGVGACRNVIEHADGTLSFMRCLGTSEGMAPEGKTPPKCRAWLYHSTDDGRTWPDRTEIETWDDTFPLFVEADFCRLPNGTILSSSRFEWEHPLAGKPLPYPPGKMPNDHAAGHMVLIESRDEGRTWSKPREFLQYSEVQGQLTLLRDGRLLCTYTHYHLPFGVAAVMSDDNGKTWDFDHPFQLALSNACCTGWATTRQLQDDTLLTVYALEPYHLEPKENGRMVCHCVRWEMPT
ncbi:MAG: sialidase family protein [Planctomycetota bacterium]